MKHPVANLKAELRRTMHAKRAELARDLYSVERLRAAMVKEAGAGREVMTVLGPAGLDLKGTDPARAAEAWLRESGIAFRWDVRQGDGDAAAGVDLVIDWREAAASIV